MRKGAGLALAALLITLASCHSTPSEPVPVTGTSSLSGTVSLVAPDGTRAPGAGVSVAAFQCFPGSNPGGPTGLCDEARTGISSTDAQGAYSLPALYSGTARIFAGPVAGYLAFEVRPTLAPGPNVLNIDLHQN